MANAPHPSSILNLFGSQSQHGQETLVGALMYPGVKGYYVDVGARCGVFISNTARLDAMGWDGICVEPHPDLFAQLQVNRPKPRLYNVAASSQDADGLEFIQLKQGAMGRSGLASTYRDSKWYEQTPHVRIKVSARTLTSILDEAQAPQFIHYLDIDVEGHELDVLKGLDFAKYDFGIVGVETLPALPDHEAIKELMMASGYVLAAQLGSDAMFIRRHSYLSVDFAST